MSEYEETKCAHCNQTDDHPKFHLLTATDTGLGWETSHHDCAAMQGHEKAALVVEHSNGAKGHELRKMLTNPDHAVHTAVAEHTESHAVANYAANKGE